MQPSPPIRGRRLPYNSWPSRTTFVCKLTSLWRVERSALARVVGEQPDLGDLQPVQDFASDDIATFFGFKTELGECDGKRDGLAAAGDNLPIAGWIAEISLNHEGSRCN